MTQTAKTGGIQSLDAALLVLSTMARHDGPFALSDLGRACGMPASKIHRYLASFIKAGLVRQNGRSGTYDLGPGAIELGLAALARHDFVNSVADDLSSLTLATNLTALLCVWGSRGPTVVRWQRAKSFTTTTLGLGTVMPLLDSATGHVFLAYHPADLLETVLSQEPGGKSKKMREAAKSRAETVRHNGYSSVEGQFIPGLYAISAPVLDWQHEIQAAVTLIGTDPATTDPAGDAIAHLRDFCARHSITRA